MRLPDVLGVVGALVVGGVLALVLLASALGQQPALPTPAPRTLPPIPTPTRDASATATPTATPAVPATPVEDLAIGERAPDFEVTLLDGSVMSTADFNGPLWINFMTTWSPQSSEELPMMQRFSPKLEGQMTMLLVDVGEDRETVRNFISSLDFELPVGVDQDGTVQRQWGAYALPVHYWLDAEGIVRSIVFGGAPEEIFIQSITEVVPEFSAE